MEVPAARAGQLLQGPLRNLRVGDDRKIVGIDKGPVVHDQANYVYTFGAREEAR